MAEPTSGNIRVGVIGARGKVGAEVCRGVDQAPDLELVSQVDVGDDLSALEAARPRSPWTSRTPTR